MTSIGGDEIAVRKLKADEEFEAACRKWEIELRARRTRQGLLHLVTARLDLAGLMVASPYSALLLTELMVGTMADRVALSLVERSPNLDYEDETLP